MIIWVGVAVVGVVVIGLGVLMVGVGLDKADKLASVLGLFVGLVGLALSVFGTLLARRAPAARRQSVTGSSVRGGIIQVQGVRGGLRIDALDGASASSPPLGGSVAPAEPDRQSAPGSGVAGPLRPVTDGNGDVDIDR